MLLHFGDMLNTFAFLSIALGSGRTDFSLKHLNVSRLLRIVEYVVLLKLTIKLTLRRNCIPNHALCAISKLWIFKTNNNRPNNKSILKQVVKEKKKKHRNFNRPSGFWDTDQNVQSIVLNNNSRTAWPTKILIPVPFLSFSKKICFMTPQSVDNIEIVHKTCSIVVWGTVSP